MRYFVDLGAIDDLLLKIDDLRISIDYYFKTKQKGFSVSTIHNKANYRSWVLGCLNLEPCVSRRSPCGEDGNL